MRDKIAREAIDRINQAKSSKHICLLFNSKEDLADILVPYFKSGLENNEFCIWVIADPLNVEGAKESLRKNIKNFQSYIKERQIEIIDGHKWLGKAGKFNTEMVLEQLGKKAEQALRKGFDRLRLAGNFFWNEQADWKDISQYESLASHFIDHNPITAVCSYPLDKLKASQVIDVVGSHDCALIKMKNKWNLIQNYEQSEHKKSHEELMNIESRMKILFEYALDAYYLFDPKGNFIDGNKAAEKLTGYKKEELTGKNFLNLKLLPAAQMLKASKVLAKNLHVESTGPDDFLLNKKGGHQVPVEMRTFPVKIQGQALILSIIRDLSERKKAEESLVRLASFAEMNPNTFIEIDISGEVIYLNPAARLRFPNLHREGLCHPFLCGLDSIITEFKRGERKFRSREVDFGSEIYEQKIFFDSRSSLILIFAYDITQPKRAEEELKKSYEKLQKSLEETINAIASALEKRDPYTAGHQQRVANLACSMAEEMGLSRELINGIRMAGLIHDVGKIQIPTEILIKPNHLSDIEFVWIRMHPQIGFDILKSIEFPYPVAQIVLQHHEMYNGSGYPKGLAAEEILQEARIIAVADVVEAMSSHRPYRPALGIEAALDEIQKNRGILYDPEAVDACLKLFSEKRFKLG
jgi:PAS domain S-box-containing protein/putative nucleotidyltransferase with HDIG domain